VTWRPAYEATAEKAAITIRYLPILSTFIMHAKGFIIQSIIMHRHR